MRFLIYNNGTHFRVWYKRYDKRLHEAITTRKIWIDYFPYREELHLYEAEFGRKLSQTNMMKTDAAKFMPKGWYLDTGLIADSTVRQFKYNGVNDIRQKYGF